MFAAMDCIYRFLDWGSDWSSLSLLILSFKHVFLETEYIQTCKSEQLHF